MTGETDYDQMIPAMEFCRDRGYPMACLALAYTLIDSFAWLLYGDCPSGCRERFLLWVDRFLLPVFSCECTAIDLYSARCAILHTLSSESDLTRSGHARPLVYRMNVSRDGMEEAARVVFPDDDSVVVDINALVDALRVAVTHSEEYRRSHSEVRRAASVRFGKKYAVVTHDQLLQLADALQDRRDEAGRVPNGADGGSF